MITGGDVTVGQRGSLEPGKHTGGRRGWLVAEVGQTGVPGKQGGRVEVWVTSVGRTGGLGVVLIGIVCVARVVAAGQLGSFVPGGHKGAVVVSGRFVVVVGHRISFVPGKQTIDVKTEGLVDAVVDGGAAVVLEGQRGSFVNPGMHTNGEGVVTGDGCVCVAWGIAGTVTTVGRLVVVGHRISLVPGKQTIGVTTGGGLGDELSRANVVGASVVLITDGLVGVVEGQRGSLVTPGTQTNGETVDVVVGKGVVCGIVTTTIGL